MRAYAGFLLAFASCSYGLDGGASAPSPPEDVTYVGAIERDPNGAFRWSTPLLPRSEQRPYDGPIVAGEDGDELWLVGFTDEQLDACVATDDEARSTGRLLPSEGTTLDLPAPAWGASGAWSDGTAMLEAATFDVPLTTEWLSKDVTSCTRWSFDERLLHDDIGRARFALTFADRTVRFFMNRGEVLDVTPLLETVWIDTSTQTRYAGGWLDGEETMWLFDQSGELRVQTRNGPPMVMFSGGPWAGDDTVWVTGAGQGDQVELFFLPSSGNFYRYFEGAVTKLYDVPLRPDLERIFQASITRLRNGDVWLVADSSIDGFRYSEGRTIAEEIGSNLGPPVVIYESERYGLLAGITDGAVRRRLPVGDWATLLEPIESGSVGELFDFGDGLLVVTRFGFFEYFEPGLSRCDRPGNTSYALATRARLGDRLIMLSSGVEGAEGKLVVWDVAVSSAGCGVFPALD